MNYLNAGAKDLQMKLENALIERQDFEERYLKIKTKNENLLEEFVQLKIKLGQLETKCSFQNDQLESQNKDIILRDQQISSLMNKF